MTVNGQLQDQPGTYIGGSKEVDKKLGVAGNLMTERLSLDANITVTKPIAAQLVTVDMI